MLSNCLVGRSWDKRQGLTPLHGFNLTTAGLLTLQHRGFCGLTRNTTTSLVLIYLNAKSEIILIFQTELQCVSLYGEMQWPIDLWVCCHISAQVLLVDGPLTLHSVALNHVSTTVDSSSKRGYFQKRD